MIEELRLKEKIRIETEEKELLRRQVELETAAQEQLKLQLELETLRIKAEEESKRLEE